MMGRHPEYGYPTNPGAWLAWISGAQQQVNQLSAANYFAAVANNALQNAYQPVDFGPERPRNINPKQPMTAIQAQRLMAGGAIEAR